MQLIGVDRIFLNISEVEKGRREPRAAMCSEVRTGMNPTKGICIEASVPRA